MFDGAGLGGELSHGTSSALLESESWFGVVSLLWGVAAGFFPWKTDVMVTSVTMFTGIYEALEHITQGTNMHYSAKLCLTGFKQMLNILRKRCCQYGAALLCLLTSTLQHDHKKNFPQLQPWQKASATGGTGLIYSAFLGIYINIYLSSPGRKTTWNRICSKFFML